MAKAKSSISAPASEHHSVSVRKIDNGWIERRSMCKGDKWSETERFHAEKPKIAVGSVKAPARKK
jgi:hypothetical protein